jgi:hypothetical protein
MPPQHCESCSVGSGAVSKEASSIEEELPSIDRTGTFDSSNKIGMAGISSTVHWGAAAQAPARRERSFPTIGAAFA